MLKLENKNAAEQPTPSPTSEEKEHPKTLRIEALEERAAPTVIWGS